MVRWLKELNTTIYLDKETMMKEGQIRSYKRDKACTDHQCADNGISNVSFSSTVYLMDGVLRMLWRDRADMWLQLNVEISDNIELKSSWELFPATFSWYYRIDVQNYILSLQR